MTAPTSVSDLADRVSAASPRLGSVRLVCVDGPAGSGKTTLAAALAARLAERVAVARRAEPVAVVHPAERVAVVHLDDLYEGWSGLSGVWDRVVEQVLRPLEQGRPGRYQRYDWGAGRFAEWVDVPVPEYLVVEGCGAAPRAVDGRAVLVVFVDAPADVRMARGLARDGEHLLEHWPAWMAEEAAVLARERTRERADVVVDGCATPAP